MNRGRKRDKNEIFKDIHKRLLLFVFFSPPNVYATMRIRDRTEIKRRYIKYNRPKKPMSSTSLSTQ